MANKLIIKADSIENIVYLIDFNNTDNSDLLMTLKDIEGTEITVLTPKDMPAKNLAKFKDSLHVVKLAWGKTITFAVSEVNEYVKGGFTKGADKNTKEYWMLRGYLEVVQSDEALVELAEIGKDIDALEANVKSINKRIAEQTAKGTLANSTMAQVGFYHKTVKSHADIDGVITYEKSELFEKQIDRFDA